MATQAQRQALCQLLNQVHDLKSLPRTGWLLARVAVPESLADHTCGVALLALFLAESINADYTAQGLQEPLDIEGVLALALIHDLGESVLTDLPKRSTDVLGKSVKHEAEARIIQELLAELPNGDHYRQLWYSYELVSTPEAQLVKDADKLDMVAQALQYAKRGQRNLREFWEGHHWYYPLCRDLHTYLLAQSASDLEY
jgi:putative hydrolase of HD superfamily